MIQNAISVEAATIFSRLEPSPITVLDAAAPLVAVVIPAFNAERTIDETLISVRAQTYGNLEIIVVDDGSTDDTFLQVQPHAREDRRVSLIRQANAGVASARNRAIAESSADFISPIDADDLWTPTRIEKQMATMLQRGPRCGLVYTWQAILDETGRVISKRIRPDDEGYVLPRLISGNFVGGGSPTLMRRQAVLDAGGYDPSLRARNAEGCEDLKLYLRISERYEFAVVKEFLTGYRCMAGRMSNDLLQMQRSRDLVADYAEVTHPQYAELARDSRMYCRGSSLKKALQLGSFSLLTALLLDLIEHHPRYLLEFLVKNTRRAIHQIGLRVRNGSQSGLGSQFLRHSSPPSTGTASG
jgi:glycosyltransferase involved in cell wall biosynthesis